MIEPIRVQPTFRTKRLILRPTRNQIQDLLGCMQAISGSLVLLAQFLSLCHRGLLKLLLSRRKTPLGRKMFGFWMAQTLA